MPSQAMCDPFLLGFYSVIFLSWSSTIYFNGVEKLSFTHSPIYQHLWYLCFSNLCFTSTCFLKFYIECLKRVIIWKMIQALTVVIGPLCEKCIETDRYEYQTLRGHQPSQLNSFRALSHAYPVSFALVPPVFANQIFEIDKEHIGLRNKMVSLFKM